LLFSLLRIPGAVHSVAAASFAVSVTTTADTNGTCSLRDAIRYANTHTSADTTTITLPAGTYNLTQTGDCEDAAVTGDLDITKNVILNGADPATTIIDGVGSDRIFDIRVSTITVSIANVTVRNGFQGVSCGSGAGAIGMVGSVTLTNVVVTNSTARSVGGINSVGNLTLINSTVSNNHACGATGIRNTNGVLTLTNSTVSGNVASSSLGSLGCPGGVRGYAGGIDASNVIHLTNSTISGNSNTWGSPDVDEAGGIRNSGTMTVAYSTIADNLHSGATPGAGGIYTRTGDSLTIQGSILARNAGGNCAGTGTLNSQGYNLSDDGSCAPQPTDMPNTTPGLGPLASNGGPTQTHALLPGSAAIDKAPAVGAGCPATDQRGIVRPYGPACDSGAYEFNVKVLPGAKTPGQAGGSPNPMPMPPHPAGVSQPGGPPAPLPLPRRP
jgi:CSLREA domain-containing protein